MATHANEWTLALQIYRRQMPGIDGLLGRLGIVLICLSAVSAALWALDEVSSADPLLWISPAILFVSCTGTAFCIIRSDVHMVASPVSWVLLASGVYWGFGPLIYSFGDWSAIDQKYAEYYVGPLELLRTNLLNSVGMLALVVGLAVGRRLAGRRSHGWVRPLEGMDAMRVAAVFTAVGLTAKFSLVLPRVFGLIETQSSTLQQMEVFSKAALMILSYLSVTKGGKATLWFVLLFVIELLTAGLVSSKMVILEVIIAVLVGRTLAVRKVSTVVKGFVLLALLQLLLQPVVLSYRMMRKSSEGDYVSSMMEAGSLMAESISDLINGSNVAQVRYSQGWWSRLCYTPQQAFAMQEYDCGRPGTPWEDVAIGLVPRMSLARQAASNARRAIQHSARWQCK